MFMSPQFLKVICSARGCEKAIHPTSSFEKRYLIVSRISHEIELDATFNDPPPVIEEQVLYDMNGHYKIDFFCLSHSKVTMESDEVNVTKQNFISDNEGIWNNSHPLDSINISVSNNIGQCIRNLRCQIRPLVEINGVLSDDDVAQMNSRSITFGWNKFLLKTDFRTFQNSLADSFLVMFGLESVDFTFECILDKIFSRGNWKSDILALTCVCDLNGAGLCFLMRDESSLRYLKLFHATDIISKVKGHFNWIVYFVKEKSQPINLKDSHESSHYNFRNSLSEFVTSREIPSVPVGSDASLDGYHKTEQPKQDLQRLRSCLGKKKCLQSDDDIYKTGNTFETEIMETCDRNHDLCPLIKRPRGSSLNNRACPSYLESEIALNTLN